MSEQSVKAVEVLPSLREIFGDAVGDAVCALPIQENTMFNYETGKSEPSQEIKVAANDGSSWDHNCCIVGAFLIQANGNNEKVEVDGFELRIERYPEAENAIKTAESILNRRLNLVEKRAIKRNIREWDMKKNRRARLRAAQVKRECAARGEA